MRHSRGFTLIELLVVISITAILVALAVPSFKSIIQSSNISSAVNSYLADMRFARSEAIRLGGAVVMCRSDAPEAASPSCATSGGNWASGWIIFQDANNNGTFGTGDRLLRVQSALTSVGSISEPNTTALSFTATGRLRSLGTNPLPLTFGDSNYDTATKRVLCVSLGGHGRIAGNGSSTCS